MLAFSAPAAVGASLGAVSVVSGLLAAFRGGLGRWPGWVGSLGALLGVVCVVCSAGWFVFLGGLTLLASFAWH